MDWLFVILSMAAIIFLAVLLVSIGDEKERKELVRIKQLRLLTQEEFKKLKSFENYELPPDYESYLKAETMMETVENESPQNKDQENIADIPKLSVLVSAKIAQEVVAQFEVAKIIDVADLLTPAQAEEGIIDLHEELRPLYEERLLAHFSDTTGIEFLEVRHLRKELAQCMTQGLKAVMQLEEVQPLLARTESEQSSGSRIEKGRSWKDIKEQHD